LNLKKISIAIDAVGIRGHGGSAVLEELVKWLPKTRPDWVWYVFIYEKKFRFFSLYPNNSNVKVIEINQAATIFGRFSWLNLRREKLLKQYRIDLVLSFANLGSWFDRIPQLIFFHQPNIFYHHKLKFASIPLLLQLQLQKKYSLATIKYTTRIFVQTGFIKNEFIKIRANLDEKIRVIPSGYNSEFNPGNIRPEVKSVIDAAGFPRITYISHPSYHKNHLNLVRAIGILRNEFPSIRLMMTIKRHDPPSKVYEEVVNPLIRYIEEERMEDSVVFAGILNSDEVQYLLKNSTIMAFPSYTESFGLGIVEAMAAGCPVVIADREYAHDVAGKAAIYFDPDNPEDIAQKIRELLQDEARRKELAKEGLRNSGRFSYDQIASSIIGEFEDTLLLKNKPGKSTR
jgi:glycosyltransferase involved in cell wall biosynthesis